MTLPLYPNKITLQQISEEFGVKQGSTNISLKDYYAGGGVVRAGTLGYPNNVPTPIPSSGQIALSNFFGARKVAVVNDFVQYVSVLAKNIVVPTWYNTGPIYITNKAQTILRTAGYWTNPGKGPGEWVNPTYQTVNHSNTVAFRTKEATQADWNALNISLGKTPTPIKQLFSYNDFVPVDVSDIIYGIYGVNSDEYAYTGFHVYDLESNSWVLEKYIGGDNYNSGGRKSWMYSTLGLTFTGSDPLDTSIFSGKKLIFPFWSMSQDGSRYNHYSQELTFAHARTPFGGMDAGGKTGLPDKGATFQQLFVPNTTGLTSPYPEIFEINGNTMTLKADIIVTTHVVASSNSASGFAPEKNREAFVFPENLPIFRSPWSERYSEYIPYVFKAGTYQLDPNVIPLYNPTIYVI